MKTNLHYSFKYFANSLSIFDLVERHFPFKKHTQNFNVRLAANPEETFLNAELERIRSEYKITDGPGAFGYHHWISRIDHPVSSLSFDFIIWSDKWERNIKLPFEIKKETITEDQTSELLEKRFFELLAKGVNDAQLEVYILQLKKGNNRSSQVKLIDKPTVKKELGAICKKDCEQVIIDLLRYMELIDEDGPILTKGRGTTLFATIDAVKDNQSTLLKRKFKDVELLSTFNTYLGMHFTQLKRNGKCFQNDKTRAWRKLKNLLKN